MKPQQLLVIDFKVIDLFLENPIREKSYRVRSSIFPHTPLRKKATGWFDRKLTNSMLALKCNVSNEPLWCLSLFGVLEYN